MKYAIPLMLAVASTSFAEDPFSCVDSDVADAFLGSPYHGRGEYSTSIPDGFAALKVPAGLSLVGSQTVDSVTTVVYKSSMHPESAIDAAVDAIAETGWVENAQALGSAHGGFQAGSRPATTLLCHEDEAGTLSVIGAEKAGQTFVSYSRHPEWPGCGDQSAAPSGHDPMEMMRLVPKLRLPQGSNASDTGMGGDGDEVSTHVDLSGTLGRSELLSYFEAQIRQQGWEFQTNWSSHLSSGSVWMLKTVEDGILIGTLHIFDSGAEPMRVRFSVNPADPKKGKGRGSWSSSAVTRQ